MGRFLPRIELLGVDIQGAGGGQRGAAFADPPQGFGAEGGILTRTFCRKGFFQGFGELTPNSLLFHPTTSLSAVAKKPTVLTAIVFMLVAVAESIEFVLTLNRVGIKATADWDPATRQLRVRVGFMAILKDCKNLKLGSAALWKKLLQQKSLVKQADQLLFNQDYRFESVMQAVEAAGIW